MTWFLSNENPNQHQNLHGTTLMYYLVTGHSQFWIAIKKNVASGWQWGTPEAVLRSHDLCCRWQPEIRENVGNQWSMTKNLLQISLEKYIFSDRWGYLLSVYIYFSRLIFNWFLVTLHWFPAFSRISGCHLQHKSWPRSHFTVAFINRCTVFTCFLPFYFF